MFAVLLLTVIFAAVLYLTIAFYRNVARYPKGPFPLPFFGNFFKFDLRRQHESIAKHGENHTGVFTIFAPLPFVIINTYEAMKEAFVDKGDDFAGRPSHIMESFTYAHNSGVINSNGEVWREQRRTALSILRDFGMGKGAMEENVQSSVRQFIEQLDAIEDKTRVHLRWPIQTMIANIINEVLFGFRYEYDDCAPLVQYVKDFNKLLTEMANAKLYFIVSGIPLLRKIPFVEEYAMGQHQRNMDRLRRFVEEQVERSLKHYNPETDEPECFVHAYMQRALTNKELNIHQLRATCHDFFMAGQETTTTTMRWAVLFLASDQKVQDKLRAEIFEVVGGDRQPSMADRPKMPYAQACVTELQRSANVLTTNVAHETIVDTTLQGQKIEKGMIVVADIHGILKSDPVLGGDGEKFRPERYLNEDGKTLKKEVIERTVPFSIGKRACAGEGLAKMELFLAVTSLVQKYRLLPSPDGPVDLSDRSTIAVIVPVEQAITLKKL